ncbi:ras-domain-containing protein [Cristinia sonorae]|uniref:Ras-domain-containing protein n=1 Tax=Cristinia sonorae TaxID=1940300 RepID=A0A8K0UI98_9AGAR|nr:ras-domain-containing protein [Cristinia sonorae]
MRTVKLVVIGASGVGKTSLRSQYISGRFTTGYRATIGADFITKTLPHHCQDEEFVTLQIWDTAGQERFSSLSSAFFRGADAVLLMFDVNQLKTMEALTKWWDEFKAKAPVPDEDANKFCCVFVANKIDMTSAANPPESRISEFQAHQFIDELIPPTSPLPSPLSLPTIESPIELPSLQLNGDTSDPPPTDSIEIGIPRRKRGRGSKPSSRSRSRSTAFRGGTIGTMTTTHSIYHTPSSSFFDHFESARASPVPTASYYSYSQSPSPSQSPLQSPRRMSSMSSVSSVPTITPSLFIKGQAEPLTACTTPSPIHPLPEPPESRPKLFFTSAKTGEGVAEVFEYIAKRVVTRWEYEEAVEARTLHMRDASVDDTIRLRSDSASWLSRSSSSCCGS